MYLLGVGNTQPDQPQEHKHEILWSKQRCSPIVLGINWAEVGGIGYDMDNDCTMWYLTNNRTKMDNDCWVWPNDEKSEWVVTCIAYKTIWITLGLNSTMMHTTD